MPSTNNTEKPVDYAWGKRDESSERDHELTHKLWKDVKQVPRLDEGKDGEDNRERTTRIDED
jgi:hypothetical protein